MFDSTYLEGNCCRLQSNLSLACERRNFTWFTPDMLNAQVVEVQPLLDQPRSWPSSGVIMNLSSLPPSSRFDAKRNFHESTRLLGSLHVLLGSRSCIFSMSRRDPIPCVPWSSKGSRAWSMLMLLRYKISPVLVGNDIEFFSAKKWTASKASSCDSVGAGRL